MNNIKKVSILLLFIVLSVITFNLGEVKKDTTGSTELVLLIQNANASSESGCISKPDNNGDCTTDGTYYFCENSVWFHDCVKGVYP